MGNKRIVVEHGAATEIAKVFKRTPQCVGKCLRFKSNSDLSKLIRHTALTQYEGVEIKTK